MAIGLTWLKRLLAVTLPAAPSGYGSSAWIIAALFCTKIYKYIWLENLIEVPKSSVGDRQNMEGFEEH
jgi:hypothetical protein